MLKLYFRALTKSKRTLPVDLIRKLLRSNYYAFLQLLQTLTPTVLFFDRFVSFQFVCKNNLFIFSNTLSHYVVRFSISQFTYYHPSPL